MENRNNDHVRQVLNHLTAATHLQEETQESHQESARRNGTECPQKSELAQSERMKVAGSAKEGDPIMMDEAYKCLEAHEKFLNLMATRDEEAKRQPIGEKIYAFMQQIAFQPFILLTSPTPRRRRGLRQ